MEQIEISAFSAKSVFSTILPHVNAILFAFFTVYIYTSHVSAVFMETIPVALESSL